MPQKYRIISNRQTFLHRKNEFIVLKSAKWVRILLLLAKCSKSVAKKPWFIYDSQTARFCDE